MSLALLAIVFLTSLTIAYFVYGGWLARHFQLRDTADTPAHRHQDNIDFIPTKKFYLFGQHFSAIAAAGPIAGPIVACQLFGWGPSLMWIAIGVVLIGAVHDFTTLMISVRHEGHSIADIARTTLGKSAGIAMMGFIWIALVYIIVAFADITAASFGSTIEELQGVTVGFNPGGAVAAASVLYLLLSIVMGLVQRYLSPPLWLLTITFVPTAFAVAWWGTYLSHYFLLPAHVWAVLIVIYCAIGSVMPVWALLQPRGFLGGFILYFALAIGLYGVFFSGAVIEQPFFKGWHAGAAGSLVPFLFVTIACGACSGFHGLVCSGTTSKQINKEQDIHAVGYGAMLAEAFVAFIALAIIMIAPPDQVTGLKPGTIYGNGIGRFLTLIIGPEHLNFAITLGAMAFSTFVFDTLDVSARLGRYLLQELTGWTSKLGAMLATLVTVGVPALILFNTPEGAWVKFWTLFGASNQLLAALSLLVIAVWLRSKNQRTIFAVVPMGFILVITVWALFDLVLANLQTIDVSLVSGVNALAAFSLIILAGFVNLSALRLWVSFYKQTKSRVRAQSSGS